VRETSCAATVSHEFLGRKIHKVYGIITLVQNNKGRFSEDNEFEKQGKGESAVSKFDFKKKYLIIYLCLIVFDAFLMLCRWLGHIVPNVRLLPDFLLDHITNFALCMLLLLIFGITVLSFGGKLRSITAAALIMSVLNIVYECFLPILNTPDIPDAVFGVIGVAVAYVFLIMLRKNGLIAK
jgi:hypothetical protein